MKSMREFDYFSDRRKPATAEELSRLGALPEDLEEQLARYQRVRRRALVQAIVAGLLCLGWLGFIAASRHELAYAFRSQSSPLDVGDVADLTPADIPHNAFVRLVGITEHRGLTQRRVRGIDLSRQELWYFRLLGSGGVFIEVLPDKEHYGVATHVEVTGRAVDPARDGGYDTLLAEYAERWVARQRPALRIIQVGVAPGDGRGAWLIALSLSALLATSAGILVRRYVRLSGATGGG